MNFAQYDSEQKSYTNLVSAIEAKGHSVTRFDNEMEKFTGVEDGGYGGSLLLCNSETCSCFDEQVLFQNFWLWFV